MPSPGLLNLRGSTGKRDVSDFQKALVFRPDLQQLQLSSAGASLSAARTAYRGPSYRFITGCRVLGGPGFLKGHRCARLEEQVEQHVHRLCCERRRGLRGESQKTCRLRVLGEDGAQSHLLRPRQVLGWGAGRWRRGGGEGQAGAQGLQGAAQGRASVPEERSQRQGESADAGAEQSLLQAEDQSALGPRRHQTV